MMAVKTGISNATGDAVRWDTELNADPLTIHEECGTSGGCAADTPARSDGPPLLARRPPAGPLWCGEGG